MAALMATAATLLSHPIQAGEPIFHEDFAAAETGKVPEGFLVLDGQFSVHADGSDKHLELPGAPLDSFGIMFGPAKKQDWSAQARFAGSPKGRKFPVFGISLNGVSGYRLQVAPAKRALEILKGDLLKASVPFEWDRDSWTQLRILLRKTGESEWQVEGKAWKHGTPEPDSWQVTWEETQTPIAGRPAIWGMPYSGTPIRFDDLKVFALDERAATQETSSH
jgi:hypothetical protein